MPTGHTYPRYMVNQLLQQLASFDMSAITAPNNRS